MKIGVDTSVIVAAVHANHPRNNETVQWLNSAFDRHEIVIAHHSVLESYAVLTRLPGQYRLSATEAWTVLTETVKKNTSLAKFSGSWIWSIVDTMAQIPVSGGAAYDFLIARTLIKAGVDCIATYNTADFRRLVPDLKIISPSD
jgi:predicted nucleic acid-binding protein